MKKRTRRTSRRRKKSKSVKRTHVYCLVSRSVKDRVYTGVTHDPVKRLKQHNGVLTGGGKYTSWAGRPWSRFILVSGFKGKGDGQMFEATMKKTVIGRGVSGRVNALFAILTQGTYGSEERKVNKRTLRITISLPLDRVEKMLAWTRKRMSEFLKGFRGTIQFSNHNRKDKKK